jgi:Leucine-rich repeat (LRR) protein
VGAGRVTAEAQGPRWLQTSAETLGIHVLRRITELRLHGSGVTDELMDPISRLHYLKSVSLSSPNLSNAGVLRLARLPNLTTLMLNGERITDDSLQGLASFPHLQRLTVSNTQVTAAGIAALRRRRPDLEIVAPLR